MNIRSMTGFARIAGTTASQLGFILSLKSVNHRFLDLQFYLPAGLESFEMQCRKMLKERIARGHIEIRLVFQRAEVEVVARPNFVLIREYLAAFRAASQEHGLSGQPDLNVAFRMPGAWLTESNETDAEREELSVAAASCVPPALDALNAMREKEGEALVDELRRILARLTAQVDEISSLRVGVRQAHADRLEQKMRELLGDAVPLDPDRILQEAAILAERSDVDEEMTRMHAHIGHFQGLLDQGGEVGKKLDFLLQEMTREANTTLSKTGGIASRSVQMTELGLAMKSEIEKAREQVQNLE